MGWYVKTEEQLLETGWRWYGDNWLSIDDYSPVVVPYMLQHFGGKHYLGMATPEIGDEVIWEEYTWIKEMLIWIEEQNMNKLKTFGKYKTELGEVTVFSHASNGTALVCLNHWKTGNEERLRWLNILDYSWWLLD